MPAESKASNWIHCFKPVMWLLLLILLEGRGGNAADITMNCLDHFREGQISNITCAVNSISIRNASCAVTPSRLDITFTFMSGLRQSLCSPQYPPTSCGPNSTAQACFCAENNTDVFTYQYNFQGSTSFQGGNFTCDICARPLYPPTRQISQNCTSIMIETTPPPPTTTTTTTTTISTPAATAMTTSTNTTAPSSLSSSSSSPSETAATTISTPAATAPSSLSSFSSSSPSETAVTANSSTNSTEAPEPCGPCAWCIALIVLSPIFLLIGVVILVLIIIWICAETCEGKSDNQKTAWGIAGIIVAALVLALGVIAVIVASIKSETCEAETCEEWCFIANIVLGCLCIAIGLIIVILLILIICGPINRKKNKKNVTEPATNPQNASRVTKRGNGTSRSRQRDTPHPTSERVIERGNGTNQEDKNGTPLSETSQSRQRDVPHPTSESVAPCSVSDDPQYTGSQSSKKKDKNKHPEGKKSSLHLSELRSGSATSSESTSNDPAAIQNQAAPLRPAQRPLPLPSVERNSAIDLLPVSHMNKTLPPISAVMKDSKQEKQD